MANSVFVCGAGTSWDFGLPTGPGLIDEIAGFSNLLFLMKKGVAPEHYKIKEAIKQRENEIRSVIKELSVIENDSLIPDINSSSFDKLAEINSGIWLATSIDNYINEQKDPAISFFGKMAIASEILRAESGHVRLEDDQVSLFSSAKKSLDFSKYRTTWLVPFFRELTKGLKEQDLEDRFKEVSLIIFNYDRCIEHFLFHAVKTYYRVSDERSAAIVGALNIIHPYGKLGALEWQVTESENSLRVGFGERGAKKMIEASRRIKTFMEAEKFENSELRIEKAIKKARVLTFLGFGFHPQNMDLLSQNGVFDGGEFQRPIFATSFDESEYRQKKNKRAVLKFTKGYDFENAKIRIEDSTCSDLITEYGQELFGG